MRDLKTAERKASELESVMIVINNRLESMVAGISQDPESWRTVTNQLRDAAVLCSAIYYNCLGVKDYGEKP